jgi:hypothetical protein
MVMRRTFRIPILDRLHVDLIVRHMMIDDRFSLPQTGEMQIQGLGLSQMPHRQRVRDRLWG